MGTKLFFLGVIVHYVSEILNNAIAFSNPVYLAVKVVAVLVMVYGMVNMAKSHSVA